MSLRNFTLTTLLVGLALLLPGCGGGSDVAHISGQVIYADQPVKTGMISFEPDGWKTQNLGIPIIDGRYESPKKNTMKPGNYLVRITAPDLSKMDFDPNPDPRSKGPKFVPLLPPSWNQQTELRVEIKSGQNEINFSGPEMANPQMEVAK